MTSSQKIQIVEIQNPKKYSADPCLYICQVHPLGPVLIGLSVASVGAWTPTKTNTVKIGKIENGIYRIPAILNGLSFPFELIS